MVYVGGCVILNTCNVCVVQIDSDTRVDSDNMVFPATVGASDTDWEKDVSDSNAANAVAVVSAGDDSMVCTFESAKEYVRTQDHVG